MLIPAAARQEWVEWIINESFDNTKKPRIRGVFSLPFDAKGEEERPAGFLQRSVGIILIGEVVGDIDVVAEPHDIGEVREKGFRAVAQATAQEEPVDLQTRLRIRVAIVSAPGPDQQLIEFHLSAETRA